MLIADGNEVFRTPIVSNNVAPYWAEGHHMENLSQFKELSVVMWNDSHGVLGSSHTSLGKISVPVEAMKQGFADEELW